MAKKAQEGLIITRERKIRCGKMEEMGYPGDILAKQQEKVGHK